MSEPQDSTQSNRKWTFDKSLNIPTMLMIAGMSASAVLYVAKGWTDQDRRIDTVDRRVDAVETKAQNAMDGLKRLETLQAVQAQSQAELVSGLRAEVRSDLKDINGKLDALLLNSAGLRPETKGWTK